MAAAAEPSVGSPALGAVRRRVDEELLRFLADRRAELEGMDPAAEALVDEVVRLIRAGGKRIRPALLVWAYRAAGGSEGEPIWRVCVALELLHTSALVHDDVMDRGDIRRGVASTHVSFARQAPTGVDAASFGTAAAIVVGDLALVLSEQALRTSGFEGSTLERGTRWFDRMRMEMAAGQYLDLAGAPDRERVAALKTGSYTAVGPVLMGTALAGAGEAVQGPLGVYARHVGEAFQLRDDVLDGDAPPAAATVVSSLVDRALAALQDAPLRPDGASALAELAELLRLPRRHR